VARRIEKQQPQVAAGESPAAAQLAELVPNLAISIAGRDLVIREYGAFEGLEVAAQAAGLMADIVAIARTRELTWSEMRRLLGKHSSEALVIAARAADIEPDWVKGLGREDLEQFLSAWFGVNVGFFVHEVLATLRDEAARRDMAAALAGTKSSPDSPPAASATSSGSGG
jgi:hypothetical protein